MGHDSIIVAVIMVGMIIAFVVGAIVATKSGNQGSARAVKNDTMDRLKHNEKSKDENGDKDGGNTADE